MMTKVSSVCVYCSARDAVDDIYLECAREVGKLLASNGKRLVYGGGSTGLMGAAADSALKNGGQVLGIIPEHLKTVERMHKSVQEHIVTHTMHERKQKMVEMSDAFIILPGGFGTLDEFFEILTWRQLNLHDKPILLVNINNQWDDVIALVNRLAAGRFVSESDVSLFTVINNISEILPTLSAQPEPCVSTRVDLT